MLLHPCRGKRTSVLALIHPRVFFCLRVMSLTRLWAPEGSTSVWLTSVSQCPGLAHIGAQSRRGGWVLTSAHSRESRGKWQACQVVRSPEC